MPPACKQEHLKAAKPRVVRRLLSTLPQPSFIPPNIPLAAGKSISVLLLSLSQPSGRVCPASCWRSKVSRGDRVTDGSVHSDLCLPGTSALQESAVPRVQNQHCWISRHPGHCSPTQQELKRQELRDPSCAEAPPAEEGTGTCQPRRNLSSQLPVAIPWFRSQHTEAPCV